MRRISPGRGLMVSCCGRRVMRISSTLEQRAMLTIPDISFGRRPTRRRWLQIGGLGALGLALPGLLRADEGGRRVPARSCVLFLLHGGPSQLDVWDMKPDAPAEVRGEFRPADPS